MALATLAVVVLAAGCGTSGAAPPVAGPTTVPVTAAEPVATTSPPADPAAAVAGMTSAAYAGDLVQLLTAPKKPPFDPLALMALLLAPSGPPYKTGPNKGSPVVTPPFALPEGDGTVYAVGDSVLLGADDVLPEALGGWDLRLDARVGRTVPEGLDVLRENRPSLGQAAIVVLGHNYGGGGKIYGYLDQLMVLTAKVQRVIVTTVTEWSPAQVEVNRAIRALPAQYPNVVVADWQAVVAANPQFLTDHVHLTRAGSTAMANLFGVLLGPARPNGRTVPPPRILPLPADGPPGRAPASTTTVPGPTTTTTAGSTTTTVATTTTSTRAGTTTTTAGPTTTTDPP